MLNTLEEKHTHLLQTECPNKQDEKASQEAGAIHPSPQATKIAKNANAPEVKPL
ncbi:hypothetical protein [Helicobacter heilmannii]|uniref:Uncharacterized protein n=1 Tax=Helicobacter heilmannii TaxID=35817 RepID=A0A0K2XK01_HELHE|nr:hypothetical protein [Helicobacter heilmannii]CCM11801.1 hypothetical protein BN341_1390 [Helicobacter heilmannii ASB1.4]CRF47651.1 hypothetical protein HHE02_09450 [Helicobacter heilmannii]CRF49609.1 hypothetical protein HHE03_12350 [Helicobacter heilmannii]CRI33942.1 hypothetical protein HHE01_16280 [Helicobacter heilmannii]